MTSAVGRSEDPGCCSGQDNRARLSRAQSPCRGGTRGSPRARAGGQGVSPQGSVTDQLQRLYGGQQGGPIALRG